MNTLYNHLRCMQFQENLIFHHHPSGLETACQGGLMTLDTSSSTYVGVRSIKLVAMTVIPAISRITI